MISLQHRQERRLGRTYITARAKNDATIMVLFLFVIMLLNLQHREEPATPPCSNSRLHRLGHLRHRAGYYIAKYAVLKLPGTPFLSDARRVASASSRPTSFPFEAVSILLLAAIVGALVLSGRSVVSS